MRTLARSTGCTHPAPTPPHLPPLALPTNREREAAAYAVRGLPLDPATGKPLPRGPTIPVPFRLATDAIAAASAAASEAGSAAGDSPQAPPAAPRHAIAAARAKRTRVEAVAAAFGEVTAQ